MTNPYRELPAIERLLTHPRVAPLAERHGHEAIVRVAREVLDDYRAEIERSGAPPGAVRRRGGRRSRREPGAEPAPRRQRERRDHPHEPRARPALAGDDRRDGRGFRGLLEHRVRPRRRGARLALQPPRRSAGERHGRGGRDRGQQQRLGAAARALRALRRRRGGDRARPARRDRRRLPHPRRDAPVRRDARRGRHDEPHLPARLRRGDQRAHRGAAARARLELPRRRLHRGDAAARRWRRSRASAGCCCSTTSAAGRCSILASTGWPRSRWCATRSPRASTWRCSPATS